MKALYLTIALVVLVIVAVVDSDRYGEVNFGYFVVIAAALLASALHRSEGTPPSHGRTVAMIADALAAKPLSLSELLDALPAEQISKCKQTVGTLLESGFLKISDGKLALGHVEDRA